MDPLLSLANRLYEVLIGNLTPFSVWGFYLLSDEFDSEPALRNKVGVVWLCSLLDSIEAQHRFLPDIAREAEELGFESIVQNSKQLQNFCDLVGELLEHYSREEQIFLVDLRNQWVHSYLAGRHRDEIAVKYHADGGLVTERLSREEYGASIQSVYGDGQSLDETLTPMIARVLDTRKHRYWYAIEAWQKNREAIYDAFRSSDTIKISV